MTDTNPQARGQTPLERILLHIVQAITVVGIIGGYQGMSALKTSNAVLQSEMRALTQRLDDLRALSSDRYTASQATRDFAPVLRQINDHEDRIRALENAKGMSR